MQALKSYNYIVIGTGIAGLSAAFKLKQLGYSVLIVEKSSHIGGTWQTHPYKNSIYEFGPNTLVNSSAALMEVIEALDFSDQVLSHKLKDSKRFLYLKNQLIEVASNPIKMLFSNLLSFRAKLRIFLEPFKKTSTTNNNSDETVHDFMRRKFGEEIASNIVASALQGIWAGDTKRLSASSALKKLYRLEQEYGSILWGLFKSSKKRSKPLETISFKNGMQSFAERIAEYIGKENILLNSAIKLGKHKDLYELSILSEGQEYKIQTENLFIATKAFEAAQILQPISLKIPSLLNQIYYAPVYLSAISIDKNLFSQQGQKIFNAFGFIDSKQDHLLLGSIFASELFSSRHLADEYLLLNFAGGARNSQILDFSENDLNETIIEELIEILQSKADTKLEREHFKVIKQKRIDRAIPQFNIGHQEIIASLKKELEKHPGIELLGNYIEGVSVADTIGYSFKAASRVQADRIKL